MAATTKKANDRAYTHDSKYNSTMDSSRDRTQEEIDLYRLKLVWLTLASALVIGSCHTYGENWQKIPFAFEEPNMDKTFFYNFFGFDLFSRLVAGLIAYFFLERVNGYIWGLIASGTAAVGFALVLLGDPIGSGLLGVGTCLIAAGLGIFWVSVPLILIQEAGKANFGLNWGITLTGNVIGMFLLEFLFDWIYSIQADGKFQCVGEHCVSVQFGIFLVLCIIAMFLCGIGYTNEYRKQVSLHFKFEIPKNI